MPPIVVIDAGHGGERDSGAVYLGREEKNDNLNLALAVGKILHGRWHRSWSVPEPQMFTSGQHRQRRSPTTQEQIFLCPFTAIPVLCPDSTMECRHWCTLLRGIKLLMAENINEELEKAGFQNLGVEARPDLAVLRRTRMPASIWWKPRFLRQ